MVAVEVALTAAMVVEVEAVAEVAEAAEVMKEVAAEASSSR